jgi:colanic acid biosynthesis glycosyl transferase WcaI
MRSGSLRMSSSAKQRVWLICELYYPEVNATGHYITQIGTGLAEEFDVNVICGQPNYLSKGQRAPARDSHKNVKIFRVWSTTLDKDVLIFRLINMVTIGSSMFLKSLRLLKRGDHVLVVTAPPSLPYTTALAALAKGASYVVLLHDLYPDILVAVGKTAKGSLLYKTVERMNRWLYKNANRLIVVGRDMYQRVSEKASGLDAQIITIPNWSDLHAITPLPKESNLLLQSLGISSEFVLMYAGNIGHPTDIETIVEAADAVNDDPTIHFVFVGSGAKKAWLEREVDRRGLSNVSVLGQLPREEQNTFLNACDVGLVSLIPGMLGTAMPSRTYNILAAGKPIIALTEPGSELAQVIDEESVGWHTFPGDAEALVAIINAAREDPKILLEMGTRARSVAEDKYSPEKAVESYAELFR